MNIEMLTGHQRGGLFKELSYKKFNSDKIFTLEYNEHSRFKKQKPENVEWVNFKYWFGTGENKIYTTKNPSFIKDLIAGEVMSVRGGGGIAVDEESKEIFAIASSFREEEYLAKAFERAREALALSSRDEILDNLENSDTIVERKKRKM